MADKKISELDAITGANTAATDVFVVVDTSTGQTKKITREELNNAIEQDVLSSIDIDTINGDFTVNGNINLGDNDKAIFGAGSDLQIYHDGSNSYVQDAGTGNLYIQSDGTSIRLRASDGTQMLRAEPADGSVRLYYGGSQKFITTSTGVDITGTVTADGLTVDGGGTFRLNASSTTDFFTIQQGGVQTVLTSDSPDGAGNMLFRTTASGVDYNRLFINNNGDISFYEDTGTTAKLFWDASAEALGLGTSSPANQLHIASSGADFCSIRLDAPSNTTPATYLIRSHDGDFDIRDVNNSATRMTIDSAGRLGLGTDSPAGELEVNSAGDSDVYIRSGDTNAASIYFGSQSDSQEAAIRYYNSNNSLRFFGHDMAEAMRIDSSGQVGIGTSSPRDLLNLSSSTGSSIVLENSTTSLAQNAELGAIEFYTNDASNAGVGVAASIRSKVSGSTGGQAVLIFSTADSVTNDVERMRIDPSGRVGIGTSSPASLVTGGSSPVLTIGGTDTALVTGDKSGSISFITNDGSYTGTYSDGITGEIASVSESAVGGAYGLAFYTGTTTSSNRDERVRIDATGDVGIGTDSPAKQLHVYQPSGQTGILLSRSNNITGVNLQLSVDSTKTRLLSYGDGITFWTAATGSGTNASERLRIDSSGNVGIGTSSPIYDLQIGTYGSDADSTLALASTTTGTGSIRFGDGTSGGEANAGKIVYDHSNNGMQFHTVATERMRIASDGSVLVGTTVTSPTSTNAGVQFYKNTGEKTGRINSYQDSSNSSATRIAFYRGTSQIGSITTSSASTAYNTSSDYRLKENVTSITDGIERVKQLNPSRFNFIADADRTVDGFLAHEAATVVPEAVTGEKDTVDEDGNPEYQGIDQSKLVPLLTAALQEAITKIEDLEARVATLEGN